MVAYPLLLLGAIKGLNLSGIWFFQRLTYVPAVWVYNNLPLVWEFVPYPDMRQSVLQHNGMAFGVSLFTWAAWFLGLVIICNALVKRSKKLYLSSSERRRNIGVHEAVAAAMYEMHGNFVNVNGIDNTVNASNIVNNYASPNNDWKLKAGLWLALTGALGNLFADFAVKLIIKLF